MQKSDLTGGGPEAASDTVPVDYAVSVSVKYNTYTLLQLSLP